MADDTYTATVAKDLEDLVPVFLANRRKEIVALREAVAASDFEQLRQIGHRMKGVGHSYGFALVSTLGKSIEDAAKTSDSASIEGYIASYEDYLNRVEIVYE